MIDTLRKVSMLLLLFLIALSFQVGAQTFEYDTAVRLSISVNSEAEEIMPLFSADGKTLIFARSLHPQNTGGKYSGHDIWTSERLDGKLWKKATNADLSFNDKGNNVVIGMTPSGDVLYLMDASSTKKVKGIYFSKRVDKSWTKPELIPIEGIESNGFLNFYMSTDFEVLFISMKGQDTIGEEDIYISLKDASGKWSKPKNLGPTINTFGFEISPFLSKDKKQLYFSSNGHPGMGDADIFVSERLYGSWEAWSVPQNLGNVINSNKFDAYFSTYGDSICFFSSSRQGSSTDIYLAYSNTSKRKELQQKEVDRLIEESKSLLSEMRDVGDKATSITDLQVLTFSEGELNSVSKQKMANVSSKIKSTDATISIVSKTNSELDKTSSYYSKVIKSELVKLGIAESKIYIAANESKILNDRSVQSKVAALQKNQFLLVVLQ